MNGLLPLHIAANLPGKRGVQITELLLNAGANPDLGAEDSDEIYGPDQVPCSMADPTLLRHCRTKQRIHTVMPGSKVTERPWPTSPDLVGLFLNQDSTLCQHGQRGLVRVSTWEAAV